MDPASGLVEGLGGKFHDVEGTQYGCGVIEVIIDSVLVIAKRVQRGDLDLLPPLGGVTGARRHTRFRSGPGSGLTAGPVGRRRCA